LWLILGFAGGIFFRSFFNFGIAFPIFLAFLGFVLIVSYRWGPHKIVTTLFVATALFGSSLGILRYEQTETAPNPSLEVLVGRNVGAVGIVVEEPDEREKSTLLHVRLTSVNGEVLEEKVLAAAQMYPKTMYGDEVRLQGTLEYPENFTTDSGKEFDYRAYLAKSGIRYEISFPVVEILSHGNGNPVLEKLFSLKQSFLRNIERVVPEPHAALLGGLVVGAKHSLGQKLLDDFRTVGVVHIVVLSGYNVTIVADFIQKMFSFLPHYFGFSFGALSIVLFALMTGATATTVRASIMALLVILARSTGRTYMITRALIVAGFFMILQNPRILAFDVSFQLSFLATIGLIYVSPLIEPKLRFVPERFGLREIVTATLATQIFVLPFLLYTTGVFSVVSLVANLFILPLVPLTMLVGFLTGVLGFITTTLSLPFAWSATAFLSFMLFIVEKLASLPFAAVSVSAFSFAVVVCCYAIFGIILFRMRKPAGSDMPAGVGAKSSLLS